jgi:hypothetical protein
VNIKQRHDEHDGDTVSTKYQRPMPVHGHHQRRLRAHHERRATP